MHLCIYYISIYTPDLSCKSQGGSVDYSDSHSEMCSLSVIHTHTHTHIYTHTYTHTHTKTHTLVFLISNIQ